MLKCFAFNRPGVGPGFCIPHRLQVVPPAGPPLAVQSQGPGTSKTTWARPEPQVGPRHIPCDPHPKPGIFL